MENKHITLGAEFRGGGPRKVSTLKFSAFGKFPGGLTREIFDLTGPEVLKILIEYKNAGATSAGYRLMPKKGK